VLAVAAKLLPPTPSDKKAPPASSERTTALLCSAGVAADGLSDQGKRVLLE
jgi:hypothetical protein